MGYLRPFFCLMMIWAMPWAWAKGTGSVTLYPFSDTAALTPSQSPEEEALGIYIEPEDGGAGENVSSWRGANDGPSVVFLKTEIYRFRPTLLEDIGSAAQWASESWWRSGNIEKRFSEALSEAYIRDGNFATSVSSPLAARPRGYSLEEDAQFRSEMARSLKRYMLVRGIPKFLSSREETKEIGKKYEKTVQTVSTIATLKVQTKAKWVFRSGINPFTLVGWVAYSNQKWNFEMNANINRGTLDIFAQRSFRGQYSGEFRVRPLNQIVIGSVDKQLAPNLRGFITTQVPYQNTDTIWSNTFHTIGARYAF